LETCRPVPCHYRLYVRGCTDSTTSRLILPQQVFPFPNAVCPCSYCRSRHRAKAEGSVGPEKAEIRVDWRRFLLSILTPTSSFETHESHTGIGTGRLAPKYMQTELAKRTALVLSSIHQRARCSSIIKSTQPAAINCVPALDGRSSVRRVHSRVVRYPGCAGHSVIEHFRARGPRGTQVDQQLRSLSDIEPIQEDQKDRECQETLPKGCTTSLPPARRPFPTRSTGGLSRVSQRIAPHPRRRKEDFDQT
jgi:hypothetical protein